MTGLQCSVDGCGRQVRCRSLCGMHYSRWRKRGIAGPAETFRPGTRNNCVVDDCDRQTRSSGSPYCERHYYRFRRTGTPNQTKPWHRLGMCSIEGCDKPEAKNQMCGMHRTRVDRHGDPQVVISPGERRVLRGIDSPRWLHDDVLDYRTVHARMRRMIGSAKNLPCVGCDKNAFHWAYDHLDPEERLTPEGVPFSIKPAHYQPRCGSCHKILDHAYLRREAIRRALTELVTAAGASDNLAAAEFTARYLATEWPRFPDTTADLMSGVGDFLIGGMVL